ncbi:MAG TPA: host attachment protein [Pseudolabrys sp.]|jgi:protein required for attachment to host cells|nr:host attachment protein [Pseudolabrys sp.]HVU21883.1 host attachment protein [Rhizomicrobium sp.]
MSSIAIPPGALVVIGDGQKVLFTRNAGDEKFPNLKTEQVITQSNPLTHLQGADRPGRAFKRAKTNLRASVEDTDWHEFAKHEFARDVASKIEKLVRNGDIKAIIIVAPPRTLADLRGTLHPNVKRLVIAEIDKDLTNHPIYEIERLILDEHSR